jgi:Ca-activated chloride channel family protein
MSLRIPKGHRPGPRESIFAATCHLTQNRLVIRLKEATTDRFHANIVTMINWKRQGRWLLISIIIFLPLYLASFPFFPNSACVGQNKNEEQPFSLEVNVDLVILNATVVDGKGNYVTGLKKEDFRLYEDEELQDISVFMPVEAPFQLVLLVDNSNSTKADLSLIKKAAINFTNELRPDDRISIVEINYFVRRLNEFTSNRKILHEEISRLSTYPYGGSRIYDGLAEGINYLRQSNPGRKAMVLLSDNMENSSSLRFEDLRSQIARNDMVFYAVTILNQEDERKLLEKYLKSPKAIEPLITNAKNSLSVLEEVYEIQTERMLTLTEESGGRMLNVRNLSDLSGEYSKVANELRNTYTMAFYSKNHWRDGTIRKLRVEVADPQLTVRNRTSYYVPKD